VVDIMYKYFEGIKKCLNEYETVMNGENAKQGWLTEDEEDVIQCIDFRLANALMKDGFVDAEKIAKFIFVAKSFSNDNKSKIKIEF
jgi:hypothetical protein